jgi:hypothetical protein
VADLNDTNRSLMWELNGAQSSDSYDWKKGVLPITNMKDDYLLVIEGTVGRSYDGDIR